MKTIKTWTPEEIKELRKILGLTHWEMGKLLGFKGTLRYLSNKSCDLSSGRRRTVLHHKIIYSLAENLGSEKIKNFLEKF